METDESFVRSFAEGDNDDNMMAFNMSAGLF